MIEVGVIGSGIFGSLAALELSKYFNVTLIEKNSDIMLGASYNNQNRLHLGFHYPRDKATAIQSAEGFYKFKNSFKEAVHENYDNFYFIASNGSKVNEKEYLDFCKSLNLDYQIIDKNLPFDINNVSIGIKCNEAVYDSVLLKKIIMKKIDSSNIQLKLNSHIKEIKKTNNTSYILTDENRFKYEFDVVLNCTYEYINNINKYFRPGFKYQYEYTVVPIISSNYIKYGITIMDGDFMTILPFGKSNSSLLYHVEHSVVDCITDEIYPIEWNDHHKSFIKNNYHNIINKFQTSCSFFLPDLNKIKSISYLQGPRIVLPKRDSTDERPSLIDCVDNDNFYSILSGKIDHSINIAEQFCSTLRKKII